MVGIQSTTAAIRRGNEKKEEPGQKYRPNVPHLLRMAAIRKKKKGTTGRKYNGLPYYIGRL